MKFKKILQKYFKITFHKLFILFYGKINEYKKIRDADLNKKKNYRYLSRRQYKIYC